MTNYCTKVIHKQQIFSIGQLNGHSKWIRVFVWTFEPIWWLIKNKSCNNNETERNSVSTNNCLRSHRTTDNINEYPIDDNKCREKAKLCGQHKNWDLIEYGLCYQRIGQIYALCKNNDENEQRKANRFTIRTCLFETNHTITTRNWRCQFIFEPNERKRDKEKKE